MSERPAYPRPAPPRAAPRTGVRGCRHRPRRPRRARRATAQAAAFRRRPRTSRRARRPSPRTPGCSPARRSRRPHVRRPRHGSPRRCTWLPRPRRRPPRAGGQRARRRPRSGARRPPPRRAPPGAAPGRPARIGGSRTTASRSRRRAGRPTARSSRRRGTSTGSRRPIARPRGGRRRSSRWRRRQPYVSSGRSSSRSAGSLTSAQTPRAGRAHARQPPRLARGRPLESLPHAPSGAHRGRRPTRRPALPRARASPRVRLRERGARSRRTSAPSQPERLPRARNEKLDSLREELTERLGRAAQNRKGPRNGDGTTRGAPTSSAARGRLVRPHREVVADREDRDVRRVEPPDHGHVAEDARVTGEEIVGPSSRRRTTPHDSPRYRNAPFSNVLDEWFASVSVMRTSPKRTVPPLFVPDPCPAGAPAREPAAQLDLGDHGARETLPIATASPTWSSCPCVTTTRSQRSGSRSVSGQDGFPVRNGST